MDDTSNKTPNNTPQKKRTRKMFKRKASSKSTKSPLNLMHEVKVSLGELVLSNGAPAKGLGAAAGINSYMYNLDNVSPRLVRACKEATGKFTVTSMKHVSDDGKHWRLLACFAGQQSSKAEIFAIKSGGSLLMRTDGVAFPDLERGFTFESQHSAILSAPTNFTNPKALRASAEVLVQLYMLDEKRMQNIDTTTLVQSQVTKWMRERVNLDGGVLRQPTEADKGWACAFQRPGSDIMERTGINTKFYRFDEIGNDECLKFSDSHVNVVPIKFVHNDGGEWICLMCFGDKDSCLAEVNVINLENQSLLMNEDETEFPELTEGRFIPIFPAGRVLRSKNKFVEAPDLKKKIQDTASMLISAIRTIKAQVSAQ